MTLKEIEKIIDEADFCWIKVRNEKYLFALNTQSDKQIQKSYIEDFIENRTYVFFKLNDNGEVEKTWKVDHIDKEKKIVKKKLDEMTKEEINQVKDRFCKKNNGCDGCPFDYGNKCLANFPLWKKLIETTKDKEIEVVE